jgi:hypothetical protein
MSDESYVLLPQARVAGHDWLQVHQRSRPSVTQRAGWIDRVAVVCNWSLSSPWMRCRSYPSPLGQRGAAGQGQLEQR